MGRKKPTPRQAPEVCPVCGEDVPSRAVACPECGADHLSGWREDGESYDGVSLPDESFHYDEFVAQEFGSSPKPAVIKTVWWVTAILVLVVLVAIYLYAARG